MKYSKLFIAAIALFVGSSPFWWQPSGETAPVVLAATGPLSLASPGEVLVEARRVCLLDLFKGDVLPDDVREVFSKTDIGEAPSVGAEKVIHRDQLKAYVARILEPLGYDSSQIDLRVGERISIRRASVQISKDEIETIYKDFIASRAPWDANDVAVRAVWLSGPPIELPVGNVSHEVEASPNERFFGNVAVTIHFYSDGQKVRSVRVTGKVDVFQDVVHSVRVLRRNEVIQPDDVELERINISDAPDRFATQIDQVVGKRLLREVGFHQPMALAEMDQPLVLKRGSAVTILYEQPGLRLTAAGQAKEDGKAGETIHVLNVTTNKIILCQVIDGTSVRAVR